MAYVVAAGYFRSELTWLAHEFSKKYSQTSELAQRIGETTSDIECARLMAKAISSGQDFRRFSRSDLLATHKMQDALNNPANTFNRAHIILSREFQRLYRKRNLIVHSGRVMEYGIESTAEKVVPLVLKGIDQLLIASIEYGIHPIEFAASVQYKALRLERSPDLSGESLLSLLEYQPAPPMARP